MSLRDPRRGDQKIVSELADWISDTVSGVRRPAPTSRDARPDFRPAFVVCGVCLAPNQRRDTSAVCKIPCHLPSESPSSSPRCGFSAGQSVQAQRMLDALARGSGRSMPGSCRSIRCRPRRCTGSSASNIVRTIVTQLWYWPLLFRELRRADVVHAFSASYTSFLLAPLPAVIVAKLLGKPVILNYHSGEAPDHLRRSAIARFVMRHVVDANVVPSTFLRDVLASFDIDAEVVPNTIDLRQFAYRSRNPLRPRLLCTRNFEPLYNVSCVLRAFARIQARYPDATLTLVGSGSREARASRREAALQLDNVTFAGRVAPSDIQRYYAGADIYIQAPSIDNMPLSVLGSVRQRDAGRLDRRRRRDITPSAWHGRPSRRR